MKEKIITTKKYELFKFLPETNNINYQNVKRLITSMKKHGFVFGRPIVVNEKMEIIDGQHRLLAARELELEVSYTIEEDFNYISANVAQRTLSIGDFIKYHAKTGKKEYAKYLSVCEKYKLPFTSSYNFLGKRIYSTSQMKEGVFEFIGLDNDELDNFISFIKEWQDKIITLNLPTGWARRSKVLKSLKLIYCSFLIDTEELLYKLPTYWKYLKWEDSIYSIIQAVLNIYNLKKTVSTINVEDILIANNYFVKNGHLKEIKGR
jgi:hypothetical protein